MMPFPFLQLKKFWFFKFKMYHILFWTLYHFLWGVAEYSLEDVIQMLIYSPRYILFLAYVFIHTLAVYFTLYFLLPRFLSKGRQTRFIVLLISCIVISTVSIMISIYVTAQLTGKGLEYFCSWGTNANYLQIARYGLTKILPHTAGAILLGLSIKLAKNWSQSQQKQQELEKEKLETELKFLRSQFNPHFLFNTINSIFFLIHKDAAQASQALGRFSDLLRYQLYECNENQISLGQEVAYLKSFVSLEKLRKSSDLQLNMDIGEPYPQYAPIAPFILMTFVENAFKHVSKHVYKENWIEIKLSVSAEHILHFEVKNSKEGDSMTDHEWIQEGGIGLQNVKRRLSLIYPKCHDLIIRDEKYQFEVELKMNLTIYPFTAHSPHKNIELGSNKEMTLIRG